MDVKSISQGGLAASGSSQTISSEKSVSVNTNSLKNEQSNSENKIISSGNTEEQIKNVTNKMNKLLVGENTHVEYEIHKGLLNAVIKIIDNKTDAVVKQIPAKQVVDAMENLYNSVGIIMDKKA